VPGEFQHPFVWDAATGMTDLGTPDGGYGVAQAINEHGEVVGLGEANGGPLDAILWRKSGGKWRMTDLGTLSGCSGATSVNASVQVVGSDICAGLAGLAFFSEDGGPIVDLNTLVPPNSGIQLVEAQQINDHGEIAAEGPDANGNNHAVLLIPCDENHPGVEGCDYSMVDAATATKSPAPRSVPSGTQRSSQSRWSNRYHMRGMQSANR
jgi:probable HAF family extracellular repeat protein